MPILTLSASGTLRYLKSAYEGTKLCGAEWPPPSHAAPIPPTPLTVYCCNLWATTSWNPPANKAVRLKRLLAATKRPRRRSKIDRRIINRFSGFGYPDLTTTQLLEWTDGLRKSDKRHQHQFTIRRAAARICINRPRSADYLAIEAGASG